MFQDLRYAFRSLLRHPLIAGAAVATLGLGIGGASAVFSVVQAVLLRPLPFGAPDRLVRIWELTRDGDRFSFSEPTYLDLRAEVRTLALVAAYNDLGRNAVLTGRGEPRRITVVPSSASLLEVLDVQPQVGRMFSLDEDRPGQAAHRVVLSDGLWRQRFGADPGIVERTITLDGQPFVVTGVMPPRFDFPGRADAWIPLAADPRRDRDEKDLAVIGRLAEGATLAQVAGDLREIARRTSTAYPESNGGWSMEAVRFSEWIVAPRLREAVWALLGAVGLLLLLACANVANLLLAQAASRQAEMQIRGALGASRRRLTQQLFTESALLAVLGTCAGVLIAVWSVDAVRVLGGDRVPRLDELRIDGTVLAFACIAGAVSCLIFGLAPALHAARVDLRSGMDGGLRYTGGSGRPRSALVVVEVALALLLVVSAGLLANSFFRLVSVQPGFDTSGALAIPIDLPSRYSEARVAGFYGDLLERVRAVPGVVAAGATSTNPFRQFGFSNNVTPVDRAADAPPSGLVQAGWRSVTPGFFEALGVPLLAGRAFLASDDAGAGRVIVVSAGLARRLWPGESAIGKQIYWGGTTGRPRTVVGVSGDIRDVQLDTEPTPILFVPHSQVELPGMTLIVRTSPRTTGVAPAVREVLRLMDPGLPAPPVYDIAASRAEVAAGPRFNLSLLAAFAGIGIVIAATGVYAMLAFGVSERRREIAVRLALGADPPRIARLVLGSGFKLAGAGVAAGTVAALGVTRLLSGLLYEVRPTDPLTFVAAAATLMAVAMLASYLPARQASGVDPAAILRD
jgi:putative ABC transport system permease protein